MRQGFLSRREGFGCLAGIACDSLVLEPTEKKYCGKAKSVEFEFAAAWWERGGWGGCLCRYAVLMSGHREARQKLENNRAGLASSSASTT